MILPYLEQGPLYNAINYQMRTAQWLPEWDSRSIDRLRYEHAAFICPSDGLTGQYLTIAPSESHRHETDQLPAATSFALPREYLAHFGRADGIQNVTDGAVEHGQPYAEGQVRHRTSRTVSFSEHAIGSGADRPDPARSIAWTRIRTSPRSSTDRQTCNIVVDPEDKLPGHRPGISSLTRPAGCRQTRRLALPDARPPNSTTIPADCRMDCGSAFGAVFTQIPQRHELPRRRECRDGGRS